MGYSSPSEPPKRLQYKLSTIEVHTKAYKTVSTLPSVRLSSRLTKTISRQMNITFCFAARSFRISNIALSHNKYGLFPLNCINIAFRPRQYRSNTQNYATTETDACVQWSRDRDVMITEAGELPLELNALYVHV